MFFDSSETDTPGAATNEIIGGAATVGPGAFGGVSGGGSGAVRSEGSGVVGNTITGYTRHGINQARS